MQRLSQPDVRRWLFHTAYCRAIFARRHRSVFRWESLDVGEAEQYTVVGALVTFEDQVVEAEALAAALDGLRREDVACLLLIIVRGFTAAEAAEIIGASTAAVAKRVSRAKRRLLNACLAQNGDQGKGGHACPTRTLCRSPPPDLTVRRTDPRSRYWRMPISGCCQALRRRACVRM
jgi:DNA-directed RNA polymerase specialized sigma24 family protein